MKIRNLILLLLIFFSFNYIIFKDNFSSSLPLKLSFSEKIYEIKLPKSIFKIYQKITNEVNINEVKECITNQNKKIFNSYKFFVAGHVYGVPNSQFEGIYKKFYEIIKFNNDFDLGIFTGDIVTKSTHQNWDIIDQQIKELNFPIHFVPGNHDVGIGTNNESRNIYNERYGETFKYFDYKDDIFIILDTNFENWEVTFTQIEKIDKILSNLSSKNKNIFIFSHQIIWFNHSKFRNVSVNSKEGLIRKQTNYWSDLEPILSKYNFNFYFISGDTGAWSNGREIFCKKIKNIYYLASGMGNEIYDNYLIFESNGKHVNIYPVIF